MEAIDESDSLSVLAQRSMSLTSLTVEVAGVGMVADAAGAAIVISEAVDNGDDTRTPLLDGEPLCACRYIYGPVCEPELDDGEYGARGLRKTVVNVGAGLTSLRSVGLLMGTRDAMERIDTALGSLLLGVATSRK